MVLKVSRRGPIPPFIVLDGRPAATKRAAHAVCQAGAPGPPAGLISASPANPTGRMLAREESAALAGKCAESGIRRVSDESYHGLAYGAVAASTALAASDDAIIVNSFSKY